MAPAAPAATAASATPASTPTEPPEPPGAPAAAAQPPPIAATAGPSAYRTAERRYRVRRVPLNAKQTRFARQDPDLGGVLDFGSPAVVDADPRVRRLGPAEADVRGLRALGGRGDQEEGEGDRGIRVYALRDRPGFYVIANALGPRAQARWARACLARFSRSRHTNLTNLQRQAPAPSFSSPSPPSPSSLWADAVRELELQQHQPPWQAEDVDAALKPLRALRWANVGQNYDWASRSYGGVDVTQKKKAAPRTPTTQQEKDKDAFHRIPPALSALVRAAAAPLGFSCVAEAGIVNFYPADASMGGHVDDAEGALAHPVVSFSLGLPAVFLLGGASKDDAARPPIPILVRSGDCLVMGGASRLCVHGVPAILLDAARPPRRLTEAAALLASRFWEGEGEGDEEEGEEEPCSEAEAVLMARYLSTSRINFNLRQVWPSDDDGEDGGGGEQEQEGGRC